MIEIKDKIELETTSEWTDYFDESKFEEVKYEVFYNLMTKKDKSSRHPNDYVLCKLPIGSYTIIPAPETRPRLYRRAEVVLCKIKIKHHPLGWKVFMISKMPNGPAWKLDARIQNEITKKLIHTSQNENVP